MSLRFRLATAEDDAALRRAFAATPMAGGVRLAFEREPSFFDALRVQGDAVQVIVCEDTATREIAGIGTRCLARTFVNGTAQHAGYLSDLRILPRWRKGTVLARGWKFLRELDADDATALYHTAIFAGNADAKAALSQARAGVPQYHPLGAFVTAGVHPSRAKICVPSPLRITRGTPAALPRIVEFLNAHNASRQFAPVHRPEDFAVGGRWRDFQTEDFFLVQEGSHILGTAGVWNQSGFKQTRVLGYAGRWRLLYHLSRLSHRVLPIPRLPTPGTLFQFGYASFLAVPSAHPEVFRLLMQALREEASKRGWMHLLLSLHELDPLYPLLKETPHTPFHGELFWLNPRGMGTAPSSAQVPHIEASLL
ncbi:hypothetical protein DES53_11411 [Roseimicrobium gellanilyticum]|uniref:N-acetyltransferase domain-containing protein n=1 Tax=Roseimicrobium gellanilyticum TaxID=748857 RepID=A0A366H5N5_9BACT|nr:hypothetical protein [Roseimicrobium gellanilyticum]RBP37273.1 hypothetical protein DES53_11411 [Roseimicrobium gellanilyticum]